MKHLKNISAKIISTLLCASVFSFTLPSLVQCSFMECCLSKAKVKRCCVTDKTFQGEKIKQHCGCEMKQAQPDLALAPKQMHQSQKFSLQFVDCSQGQNIYNLCTDVFSANHSPPILYQQNLYITNLNLRI